MTCWSLALNTANTIPQHTRPNCTGPSNAFDRSTNAVGGTCRWRCRYEDHLGSQSRSAGLVRRSGDLHFRRSILDLSDLFRRRPRTRSAQPVHALQTHERSSPTIWSPFLRQTFLDAFSSPDLVSWTRHPRVLDVKDVDWAAYAVWAPSAIEQDGRYFLFFGANDIKNDRQRGGCASRFRWPGPVAFRAIADPGSGLDRSRSPGWRDRLATVSRYVAPTFRDFCRPCMSSAQQGINGERNC